MADVEATFSAYGHVVMVLSENQPEPGGHVLGSGGQPRHRDAFGHAYYDSPAETLANLIRRELGLRARFEKYGTLQRMSIACRSETDAAEALAVGRGGARLALAGKSDRWRSCPRSRTNRTAARLGRRRWRTIANQQRLLPSEMIPRATRAGQPRRFGGTPSRCSARRCPHARLIAQGSTQSTV